MLNGVRCIEINSTLGSTVPEFDIVFVHGLGSSAESAWETETKEVWPTWISQTIPRCRTVLLNYPSPMFFGAKESAVSIMERARNLADFLPTVGLGQRPTVFVCHSLGGLLIKEVLRASTQTGSAMEIGANTIGALFLATPHSGADLANYAGGFGSQLTKDLKLESDYLLDLRSWFAEYSSEFNLFVSSYYETQPYKGFHVVSSDSANPLVEGCSCVGLDANHSSICKPSSIGHDIFLRIKRDIEHSIGKVEKMGTEIVSLDDVIALPILTNHMFFDVVNLLNRELSCGPQKAVVINNPGSGSKPCCIIISEHAEVLEKVSPLARRWPDRFSVQGGMLGEFTSGEEEEEAEEEEELEQEDQRRVSGRSNFDGQKLPLVHTGRQPRWTIEEKAELSGSIAQYISENLRINLRAAAFKTTKLEVKFFFSLHSFEATIRDQCERIIRNTELPGDRRKSALKRIAKAKSALKAPLADNQLEECVADAFRKSYDVNSFWVCLWDEESSSFDQENDFQTKISRIDHTKDLIVMSFQRKGQNSRRFNSWRKWHRHLELDDTEDNKRNLSVGDICTSPAASAAELKVETLSQNVLFPMRDKVTSLNCVIVLSGGTVQLGSSGSSVHNEKGKVAAMVIGRALTDGQQRILAVPISEEDFATDDETPDRK